MGSGIFDKLKAQGQEIERGGAETMVAYPHRFVVVGLDIEPEALIKLYPDDSKPHARARAIVLGIRDRTRVSKPPAAAFVARFRKGTEEAITVANLGPDMSGRLWIVVCKGRNRTMAQRAWNDANPSATWQVTAYLKPFTHNDKAGIDAELDALESNAMSNCFVAEMPSTKADRAQAFKAKGKAPAEIALLIGARDADEVNLLARVGTCHQEVTDALDAGKVGLVYAAGLADLDPIVQVQRIRRKLAPNRKAANAAAAPRAKARPAAYMVALAAALPERTYDVDDLRELIAHLTGGAVPAWMKAAQP